MYTDQQAFDIMVSHLRAQQCRSADEIRTCLYRGPNGLKCAVGVLIPDDQYSPAFEGWRVSEILDKVPALHGSNFKLLRDMQIVHDVWHVEKWEECFAKVARMHNLSFQEKV